MTFLSPWAFYLLLTSLLILLLHFMRARERQRTVSALFLWEGLSGDPQSRAARVRQQFDPLLLLQLAILLTVVLALTQPVWRMRTATVSGLAIVLDGSASMRTHLTDDATRYDLAVKEADALLDRHPTTTAVLQLSAQPTILARPGLESGELRNSVLRSEPTWYADGTAEDLLSLLGSIGGTSQFQKVVIISDHAFSGVPESFETILTDGGSNLSLTEFSVRENPSSPGVTAFVTAQNSTDTYQNATIKIDDRENQTTLSFLMPPSSIESYVIPFPNSRGTLFTARLHPDDDFAADNRRYFALDRPIGIRVHWLGSDNRYVMAALRSVVPIVLVDAPEDADLAVVHDAVAPASQVGAILVIHGGIDGLVVQGEAVPIPGIQTVDSDHPLLNGVDPAAFLIREAPAATLPASSSIALASGAVPLLATYADADRSFYYLAPDILETNLPITVDFPILIRNILSMLVRLPAELSYRSAEVGEPVSLAGRGTIESIVDATRQPLSLPDGLSTIRPESPGFHTLFTDRGAFAIAVNIPIAESSPPTDPLQGTATDSVLTRAVRHVSLWRIAVAMAIVLLLAELHGYSRQRTTMRRTR